MVDIVLLSEAGFATLVPIRDMGRAVKLYASVLGGKLTMRGKGDMKDSWASVRIGKADFWLIPPSKREKRELAYSVFLVKNIRKAVKDLKGKGVGFQRAEIGGPETKVEGPISFNPWGAVAFFKDSEANLLMVWQGE